MIDDPRDLEDLFERATRIPERDLEPWLFELKRTRPRVADGLEALLDAHRSPDPRLDEPADLSVLDAQVDLRSELEDLVRTPTASETESWIGREMGGYRILAHLGSGSMGAVFLAEQESPQRAVALKILHAGEAGSSAARRFLGEIETLARLDHPNVAKIHGAGFDESPRGTAAWFAMELIHEPNPLVEFCCEAELSLEAKLRLFQQACAGVHHAHRRGFLHRDLKSANLLVSSDLEDPVVKVIDFGVARALAPLDGEELERTRGGELLGTLSTMSPEQCAGRNDDVDVRSDVYSLGVILYQVVCGRLPYELEGASMFEVLRRIQEEPPVDPSCCVPELQPDLRAILIRGLEKEPELRYDSPLALSADIERYLEHLPVEARRSSAWHRLQLFARRRRGFFLGSAAAALLFLLAMITIAVLFARSENALRDYELAEQRVMEQAEAVRAARGDLDLVRETLAGVLGEEDIRSEVAASVVRSSSSQLERTRGLANQRRVVGEALEKLAGLDAALRDEPEALASLAQAYEEVGSLHGTEWNANREDARIGLEAYERAVELWRAVLVRDPEDRVTRERLTLALCHYVHALRKSREFARATAPADEAVAMGRALLASQPDDLESSTPLISALWARGDLYIHLDKSEQGVSDSREAVELCERGLALGPRSDAWLTRAGFSHFRLGIWLEWHVPGEEPFDSLRRASELILERCRENHSVRDGYDLLTVMRYEIEALSKNGAEARALELAEVGIAALGEHLESGDDPNVLATWTHFLALAKGLDPRNLALDQELQRRWSRVRRGELERLSNPTGLVRALVQCDLHVHPEVRPLLVWTIEYMELDENTADAELRTVLQAQLAE